MNSGLRVGPPGLGGAPAVTSTCPVQSVSIDGGAGYRRKGTGEMPECPFCFARPRNLDDHVWETHEGWPCPEGRIHAAGALRRFRRKYLLTIHLTKYKCKSCPFCDVRPPNMDNHVWETHRGWPCTYGCIDATGAPRQFRRKYLLAKHKCKPCAKCGIYVGDITASVLR